MLTFKKFSIDDCFHCNHILKEWKNLESKFRDRAEFQSVHIHSDSREIGTYNLTIFPCIIVEDNGIIKGRIEGVITPEWLREFVQTKIGDDKAE